METRSAKEILDRYKSGNATEEEKSLVEMWFAKSGKEDVKLTEEQIIEAQRYVFQNLAGYSYKTPIALWRKIAAAASLLLMLSFGGGISW